MTYDDFKSNLLACAEKPENQNKDGSINWNFVESDMYIDHGMTDSHRGAFNIIADGIEASRKLKKQTVFNPISPRGV